MVTLSLEERRRPNTARRRIINTITWATFQYETSLPAIVDGEQLRTGAAI